MPKDTAKRVVKRVLEWVYPEKLYCMACGHPIDREMPYGLCGKCFSELRFLTDAVTEPEENSGLCVYAATRYDLWEKEILYALKYNGAAYYAKEMGRMMADMLRMHRVEFDVVVPVPMFPEKEARRGYNQAALLASEIASAFEVPCIADAILRVKSTDALKTLGYTERRTMLREAFRANPRYVTAAKSRGCATRDGAAEAEGRTGAAGGEKDFATGNVLAGKRVLLVDDIYTSGSTTEVCAKVLQNLSVCDTMVAVFSKTSHRGTA